MKQKIFDAKDLTGWVRAGYAGTTYEGAPITPGFSTQQELELLKMQANYVENSLKEINQRIDELQRE